MIEGIRVTLWDVFTFFLTGFFITAVAGGFWLYQIPADVSYLLAHLSELSTSVILVAAPLFFTLLGLLIEPFANYFDLCVFRPTIGKLLSRKDRHAEEEKILVETIRENYLGELGERISNPFHICKDYVEAKALSTTFMVYLARYGFYRNCAFISIVSGVYSLLSLPSFRSRLLATVIALGVASVFKRRSEDFYSYQASAIYRAFLIDKVKWNRSGAA